MTPAAFVMELKRRFPRAKLTAGQEAAFCSQVSRFRPDMELADTLWEHVQTVWPSGADIAKHARRSSGQTDRRSKVHAWPESDCRHCGGEGRITLFGEMLYGTQGAMDEFHVELVGGYSSAATVRFKRDHGVTLVEMFARCACPAGDAETLWAYPKWSGTMIVKRRPMV